MAWRPLRQPAEAWDAYVKSQYGMAWKNALTLLDQVKPLFLMAVAKDSRLASKYQGLAEMFDAPKEVAKLANATKKKNAKTRAAATAAQAAAATSVESAATAPATTPKSVTVNA